MHQVSVRRLETPAYMFGVEVRAVANHHSCNGRRQQSGALSLRHTEKASAVVREFDLLKLVVQKYNMENRLHGGLGSEPGVRPLRKVRCAQSGIDLEGRERSSQRQNDRRLPARPFTL